MSSLIQKSLKKTRPIWLMRQAGRYLPEYQKIRKKQKNFINFCLNIHDATEVTLQPVKRYNLDAAIIFSDILVIPYALGQEVNFKENPFETVYFENTNPTSESRRTIRVRNSSPILVPFHWSVYK